MKPLAFPKSDFERRSTIILVQYWNELRGDSELPSEDQIDPDRLIGVWERCFLVQMRDIENVKHYNYTYFGSDLQSAYQDGRLEEGNPYIPCSEASKLSEIYLSVTAENAPIMHENQYEDSVGRTVKYRQIFLPFGKPDGTIEAILGESWFRLD